MDPEEDQQKVYVAVGNDLQEGFKTLYWTLGKWKSQSFSIVITHVTFNIPKDFVSTPFGKLPATSMSDEKLAILNNYEEGKTDNLLSKYIGFCATAKVKAEILKVEKNDEPIHEIILDLISRLRITKLVMGFSFMKSSSWKSRSAISGSFYVHLHKPTYCELFIICGGKRVFLKGDNDEGILVDDQGVTVARMREKANFKSWITKIFSENGRKPHRLSTSSKSLDFQNQWENCVHEIENYFQQLSSLNLDGENLYAEEDILRTSPTEPNQEEQKDSNMSAAEKMESLKAKISEAREMTQLKRRELKANDERHAKAEWAICICNTRAEQLETLLNEEVSKRVELQKSLDIEKEQLFEVIRDLEESKSRLSSLVELKSELSSKLQLSTMAKRHTEVELENAVSTRAEMVPEIEELRRQRDVLRRRIEFCKEKDAIGMVSRSTELSCGFREYEAEDIRLATEDFSERLRLKCGGDWTNVYRGRINYATVAIKMLRNGFSPEEFQTKVKLLTNIRHPHLVGMIGFCSELKCIILEYMHSGNLRDILFTSQRNYSKCGRVIRWGDRVRIAQEVCSGLGFLHSAEPSPIVHGHLNPSNILLDRNHVAKISGFGLSRCDKKYMGSDIRAFGMLLLHLLTGRNWAGLVEEALALDRTALFHVLDERGGKWPLDLAGELAGIAMKCLAVNQEENKDLSIANIVGELNEVRKKADGLAESRENEAGIDRCDSERENKVHSNDVPRVFLCPIFQDVMKKPHVAADGFSYELEAIEEWLGMGHDTSPMTNLRLKHKFLTPNHTLRSLIQEWQSKNQSVPS